MKRIPPNRLPVNSSKPLPLAKRMDENFKNTSLNFYDTNKDGKVTVKETNASYNGILKNLKAGKAYFDDFFKKADVADGKQDGKVKADPHGMPSEIALGSRFDLNQDNTVTRAEIDKSFQLFQSKAVKQQATLSASDTNKDGVISSQEYKQALDKYKG